MGDFFASNSNIFLPFPVETDAASLVEEERFLVCRHFGIVLQIHAIASVSNSEPKIGVEEVPGLIPASDRIRDGSACKGRF
jgi:hypothetical protein